MTEYGTLKLVLGISYYDIGKKDAEKLEENIENRLSRYGTVEINQFDADEDVEAVVTLETDTKRHYCPPSWDDYGGDAGSDELEFDISESDIESLLEYQGNRAYVHISDQQWEAA